MGDPDQAVPQDKGGPKLAAELRVTYIHGRYPVLTETFIDREIKRLFDLGVDLKVLSIRRPADNLSDDQRTLSRHVTYLLPASIPQLIAAHIAALRRPYVYLSTLLWLITRPHSGAPRYKTALHFATGVYGAWILRDRKGIHLHAHFADRAATVAFVASRLLSSTYSVTAHATDIYVKPVLLREKIGRSSFTVTCTEHNRRYLAELVGPRLAHRIVRLYHGVDVAEFSAERPPSQDDRPPLLIAVAQLSERKGLRYLIEACRALLDRGRPVTCEIIGEGDLRAELQELIDRLGLQKTVVLSGALPHSKVAQRYGDAAAFVLPCVVAADGGRDGIPNVILEAMASGLPVVSTSVSGIPEAVRHGVTGLLVPERDADAVADAVDLLLTDNELSDRLRRQARDWVSLQFDVAHNVAQLIEQFETVAARREDGR